MEKLLNLRFLLVLALASVVFISCEKDDDDDDDGGNNSLTFDGTSYEIKDGMVENYGAYSPMSEQSHWNYDFYVVDQPLVQVTEGDDTYWDVEAETYLYIYSELFSPGTSSFQTGTFTYMDYEGTTQADIEGKYFFFNAEVAIESDGDDMGYDAIGGTIKVSGSDYNYTIEYDLQLEGGKTAVGSYSGTFKYEDDSMNPISK
jgi:hypothetical protein